MLVAQGTPAPIMARLDAKLNKVVRSPNIRARLAAQGADVVTMTPAEQDRFFNQERHRWAEAVQQAAIRLD